MAECKESYMECKESYMELAFFGFFEKTMDEAEPPTKVVWNRANSTKA